MGSLKTLLACLAGGALVACSGAPPEGGADYEIEESSGNRSPSASADEDEGTGDEQTLSNGETTEPSQTTDGNGSGVDTGGGTEPPPSDPTPADPAPKPTAVTVKIDGATYTVSTTNLWSEVQGAGKYNIFIKLTGPGAPDGSDIHISADHTGTGCVNTTNYLAYRPQGSTQYMPMSANEPTCGLSINELPKAVGGRFRGSFTGTMRAINTTPLTTKRFEIKFDVLRDK